MTKQSYDQLVDELIAADHAYWVQNQPIMSDYDYDLKMADLLEMESSRTKAGCLNRKDSPTQRLGADILEGFSKVAHETPMLSLENCYDHADLEKRLKVLGEDRVFCVEPKIDGLSLNLFYSGGTLMWAGTRGRDGVSGDDVSANARTIRSIPLKLEGLPKDSKVHVRGEVFLTFVTFKKLNEAKKEAGEQLLANPRNAAAGALKLLDSKECAKRHLSFVPYQVVSDDMSFIGSTHGKVLVWLMDQGFEVMNPVYPTQGVEETMDAVIRFEAVRKGLEFPTDGAVVKLNNLEARKEFANKGKSVGHSFAYKYAPPQAEMKLKFVTFQVGKTGIICPVGELFPTELDGSMVARVTLCNEGRMDDLGLTEGSVLTIRKAGEIIPECLGVAEQGYTCPGCGFVGTKYEQEIHHRNAG